MNEILRTKVLKSCDEWTVKLEDVRKTQESKELLATAERVCSQHPLLLRATVQVQHYVEKVEKARDHKSGARNQDKLNAATNAYEAVAAPIMKEMDLVLVRCTKHRSEHAPRWHRRRSTVSWWCV